MNIASVNFSRGRTAIGALACVAAVCLLVGQVYAQWMAGNGVAYTAGTPVTPAPPYDPVNNNGLDGSFLKGTNAQNKHYVKFMVEGCCIQNNFCPLNWQKGVDMWVDYSVHYVGGSDAGSEFKECCPAECCPLTITATEGTPGAWGGHDATSVTINVLVRCICCQGAMTMGDSEWGHNQFLPQDLMP